MSAGKKVPKKTSQNDALKRFIWFPIVFHFSAIKDGYESDSTLVFKRRENYTPRSQTPAEAKTAYTQIQKGGDIPVSGLRMSLPDRPKGKPLKFCMTKFLRTDGDGYLFLVSFGIISDIVTNG